MAHSIDSNRPVLIVDDSPMYRTAAKGMLQRLGYPNQRIDFAQDAKEARLRCAESNYALILFDYNLGKQANGYQLIDQLKFEDLLSPDCVIIIVTGDGTPEVVRGFMELEPDGYLLKPLSYDMLKERLPQFCLKKRHLSGVLNQIGLGKYQSAIDMIDQAFYRNDEVITRGQLLKARALLKLGQLDDARNVLINLKGSSDHPSVLLELAKLACIQRQYKQGLFLTELMKKDALRRALAHDIACDIHALQHQYQAALEEIEAAIEISPKMLSRHEKKVAIHVAQGQLPDAIVSLKVLSSESKNSFRESVDHLLLTASLHLDLAQFGGSESLQGQFARCARLVEQWRQSFTRDQYKAYEALFFCRIFHLKSEFNKSRAFYTKYKELTLDIEEQTPSLFESMELAKAAFLMNDLEQYKAAVIKVNQLLEQHTSDCIRQGWTRYFHQYRTNAEQSYAELKKVKEYAKAHISNRHYDKAINLLGKSVKDNRVDSELCLLTLEAMTKSWPHSWSKSQVAKVAMVCKEHLRGTPQSKTRNFQTACNTLAKQLDFSELRVTSDIAA